MIRVEIIANHSVEENVLEALAKEQVGKYYTKLPSILGVGSAGPRMGDAIWPEENFALIIWCELEEALGIKRAITKVKEQFPDEGIKFFSLPEIKVKSAAPPPAVDSKLADMPKWPDAPAGPLPANQETKPANPAAKPAPAGPTARPAAGPKKP